MSEKQSIWSKPLVSRADGITLRALILSLAVTIFSLWFGTYTTLKLGLGFEIPLFGFLFVEFILSRFLSRQWQLSVPEWVTFTIISSASSATLIFFLIPPIFGPIRYPDVVAYAPQIWMPNLDAEVIPGVTVLSALSRATAFNLSLWITPLLYWSLAVIAYYFMGFFLLLPLRKIWIDQERLAFPNAVPTYELVKYAKGQDRPSFWSFKGAGLYFAVGIVIGLLFQSYQLIQWFGGTAVWAGSIDIDLTPILGSILPNTNLVFFLYLASIPVWIFASLDILGTSLLGWAIIAAVIPYLLYATGIDPVFTNKRFYGLYNGAFRWQLMFTEWYAYGGIVFGVVIWVLFQAWRRYRDVIKAAIKGEMETGEAASWRMALFGLLASFLVFVGLMMTAGASIVGAFLATAFLIIITIYYARYFGELSTTPPGNSSYGGFTLKGLGSSMGLWPATSYNKDSYVSMLSFQTFCWTGGQQSNSMAAYSMLNFKTANMTRTDNKTVLLATAIMVVVSIFLVGPIFLDVLHNPSVGGFDLAKGRYWGLNYSGDFYGLGGFPNFISRYVTTNPTEARYGLDAFSVNSWIAAGTVIVLAMFWLRTVFPWFFLNPLGLAMIVRNDELLAILVAFVVKSVTLKFGGAKAYEEVVVPIAVGTLVGIGLMGFIAGVVLPLWGAV